MIAVIEIFHSIYSLVTYQKMSILFRNLKQTGFACFKSILLMLYIQWYVYEMFSLELSNVSVLDILTLMYSIRGQISVSLIRSIFYSLTHSLIHSPIHSFIHSYSFIHLYSHKHSDSLVLTCSYSCTHIYIDNFLPVCVLISFTASARCEIELKQHISFI